MQASKIKLGETYGVKGISGGVVVTELVTVKTLSDTKNYVTGWTYNGTTRDKIARTPVDEVIDDYETLQKIAKERAERQAVKEAAEKAHRAKQEKAVSMLANAIGAQAVFDRYSRDVTKGDTYDHDKPAVIIDGTRDIEINQHAWDQLIAWLEAHVEANA